MTREGRKAADSYGLELPSFNDLEEATQALYSLRDVCIRKLVDASTETPLFTPDFSPASLKDLETWYFALWADNAFPSIRMTCADFESSMAMYFGQVLVENVAGFEWVVAPYAFDPNKYELGVSKPLHAIMLRRFTDLHETPNNKRHQSLWRRYQQYAG